MGIKNNMTQKISEDIVKHIAKLAKIPVSDKEKKELEILQKYVPKEMSEEELTSIVKTSVQESGLTSKADAGKAMKIVMEKLKGKADGKIVNKIVLSLLK